jgi:putative hydrolase of the HAD superfamily
LIRAVSFDAGGTLIEPWPSVGHIYAEVATRFGVPEIPPQLLNDRFAAAWKQLRNFGYTQPEWAQLVDVTFAGLCEIVPSRTFFSELYSRFGQAKAWRVFDDVAPALEAMKAKGIRLAVISNWDERLRPLLHELGLEEAFEAIIVSCEVGSCKPSRLIFERASRQLGISPGEILHVGDRLDNDVAGAGAAGFQAAHLNRKAVEPAAAELNSLRGLIRIINETE